MKVLIIDNYDSFVYNLAQYIGEMGVQPIVYRNDQITLNTIRKIKPERIVISPGPGNPQDKRYFGNSLSIIKQMGRHVPLLGVCLGHQGIVYAFGGKIVPAQKIMHGKTSMIKHNGKGIFKGVKNPFKATRYHSLVAEQSTFPTSLIITAESLDDGEIMGICHSTYPTYGVQFHPESILTVEGKKILKNFIKNG